MAAPELLSYIETQRAAGFTDEQIKKNVISNGWSEQAVDEAFAALNNASSSVPKPGIPATATPTQPAEMPGVIELLKTAWQMYRDRLQTIFMIQLVPGAAVLIFGLLVGMSVVAGIAGSSVISPETLGGLAVGGGIVFFLAVVALIIVYMLATAALAATLLSDKKMSVGEAFSEGKKYFWQMFVVGLIIFGVVFTGSLLFLIPGIIMAGWFSFAGLIVISEQKKGLQALVASRRYISKNWWAVVGRGFGAGIIVGIIYAIVVGIVSSINESLGSLVDIVISTFVMTPIIIAVNVQLLKYLQQKKGVVAVEVTSKQRFVYTGMAIVGYLIIPLLIVFLVGVIAAVNPAEQIRRAQEVQESGSYQMMQDGEMGEMTPEMQQELDAELQDLYTQMEELNR